MPVFSLIFTHKQSRRMKPAKILGLHIALAVALLSLNSPVYAAAEREKCLAVAENDPDRAMVDSGIALRQNPGDRDAMLCRATAEFNIGDFPAAGRHFHDLARAAGQDNKIVAGMLAKAGWAFLRAGNAKVAEQELALAVHRDPGNMQYWQDHAAALMSLERYWDAVRELDYVIKRDPTAADALAFRADCWLKLGQDAKARSDSQAALALKPKHDLASAVAVKLPPPPEQK
ncbi:MAG: hypothetical protein WDO70_11170 [Alphaproteobacteria bacterium]